MQSRTLATVLVALFFNDASAVEWKRDWLVPGGPFRGIHGLAIGPDGMIWVGSIMGRSIYRVDPASGRAELVVSAPEGEADDLEFAADGTLVDPASGRKETIATALPLGVMDLPGMLPGIFPTGVATAEDGSVLVSSDVEGGIVRLRRPAR